MRFKVGDRTRFVGTPGKSNKVAMQYVGQECEIIFVGIVTSIYGGQYHGYSVLFKNGSIQKATMESSLEPILKPPELGSLDEIKKLTGWYPGKVRETAT